MPRTLSSLKIALVLALLVEAQLLSPPALHAKRASGIDWRISFAQGERFLKTKQLDKAELSFRQAYKDVKLTPGRTDDDEILCIEALADVLYQEDQVDETLPLYKKSLRLREKSRNQAKVVPAVLAIAGLYEGEGDYDKAVTFYQRAIGIVSDGASANPTELSDFEHRLGRVLAAQGRLKEAESMYFSSLSVAMSQPHLPLDFPLDELIVDYMNLLLKTEARAKVLKSAFQFELLKDETGNLKRKRAVPPSNFTTAVSVQLADQAAEAVRKKLENPQGSANDKGIEALKGLDGVASRPAPDEALIDTGNRKYSDFAALDKINQQRIDFYERMIATDIDALGRDHPSVARDLSGLASIYLKQHKYDEAKPLLERARQIYRNVYKADAAPLKHTELLLRLISEEQLPGVSTDVDLSYIENLPKIPIEAEQIEVALRLNDLAFMLYSQGQFDNALKTYYWALASTSGATGGDSLLSAASMTDMSRILRQRGRAGEAQKLEETARAILRRDLLDRKSKLLP